jgi:hypothetical protein
MRADSEHLSYWEEEQMRLDDEADIEHGPLLEGDVPPPSAAFAPQLRFDADGNIILDADTLQVTANRAARSGPAGQIEEEPSVGITSSAYMHRAPSTAWATADTYSFFEALRLHGTDFTLIASKFPDRNRRQIKNKFKREEKERPQVGACFLFFSLFKARTQHTATGWILLSWWPPSCTCAERIFSHKGWYQWANPTHPPPETTLLSSTCCPFRPQPFPRLAHSSPRVGATAIAHGQGARVSAPIRRVAPPSFFFASPPDGGVLSLSVARDGKPRCESPPVVRE